MIQKKSENGITLIALVVTIVVLLILAGITINLVFSEDGIISKARLAAERTEEGEINDQESINQLSNDLENYMNDIKIEDYSVVPADTYNSAFALVDNETGEYVNFGERVIIYYGEDVVLDDNVESMVAVNYNDILSFWLVNIRELLNYQGEGKVIIYKDGVQYEWEGTINTSYK